MTTFDTYWDFLIECGLATEEELSLVCALMGTNEDTLASVLFVRTGYRSLEQLKEAEGWD